MVNKVKTKRKPDKKSTSANVGFEEKLWKATDKLCNNVDVAEYATPTISDHFVNVNRMVKPGLV